MPRERGDGTLQMIEPAIELWIVASILDDAASMGQGRSVAGK